MKIRTIASSLLVLALVSGTILKLTPAQADDSKEECILKGGTLTMGGKCTK